MQYRTLGHTGVQVSSLALGAMNFGRIGRTTQEPVTAIVDAPLASGINLIDTTDVYSGGGSEEMVGKAIEGRRDDIVLATKAGLPRADDPAPGAARVVGWSPSWTTACDGSVSTTSTSTRSIAGTRPPAMRKPFEQLARWPTKRV